MPAIAVMLAWAVAGCPPSPSPQEQRSSPERVLTVLAASSLQDVMKTLQGLFERENPGTHVRFAFAGSQQLQLQIEHGARADVYVAADVRHIEALQREARRGEPVRFTCNTLVIAVPRGNPAKVKSLADLARTKNVVLAAAEVPAGALSEQVLSAANALYGEDFQRRVHRNVRSRELNVRQVLAKLSLGEADAALVYRTDVAASGERVEALPLPEEVQAIARYAATVLNDTRHADTASAFLAFLEGPAAATVLRQAGFISCPEEATR